jgi:cell division protein ZapA
MLPCSIDEALEMSGVPVELRVAGNTYRVVASAEEDVLHRLAAVVDAKVNELTSPGRQVSPQALLLAAISLAHELEEERRKRRQLEDRARNMFSSLLERVDAALEETAELDSEPSAQKEPLESEPEHDEHPPEPRF